MHQSVLEYNDHVRMRANKVFGHSTVKHSWHSNLYIATGKQKKTNKFKINYLGSEIFNLL